ncbi:hypothetical protein OAD66_08930 [Bacteroidia bacterium]|nr:hypothetical protein [Bacteroidia bacterium]
MQTLISLHCPDPGKRDLLKVWNIYKITTDYGYSTMRVVTADNDSIYLNYNDYEIDKKSEVKDIDIPSNYTDSLMYAFSTEQIKEMYAEGEIYDIKRR